MENGGGSNYFTSGGALQPLIERRGLDAELFFERFNQTFTEYTTWLRFGSVLLSGLLLKLLYLGTRRLFAEHLVFSFHYFSVDFIVNSVYTLLLIVVAAVAGLELPLWASWLLYLGIGPYAFLALRRVYGESAPRTAPKTVAFIAGQTLIYFLVVFSAMLLAFFLTN